jgi:hypothetical protein
MRVNIRLWWDDDRGDADLEYHRSVIEQEVAELGYQVESVWVEPVSRTDARTPAFGDPWQADLQAAAEATFRDAAARRGRKDQS